MTNAAVPTHSAVPSEEIQTDENPDNGQQAETEHESELELDRTQIDKHRFITGEIADPERNAVSKERFYDAIADRQHFDDAVEIRSDQNADKHHKYQCRYPFLL
jgi:hypothetical protein